MQYGHPNTYLVSSATVAIGDFVGVENTFEIIYRCKVSGTPTQWAIAARKVPGVANTGLIVDVNLPDNHPALTTPQLQAVGLGFSGIYYQRGQWPPAVILNGNDQPVMSAPQFWKNLPAADSEGYVELGVTVGYRFSKINNNLDAILDGNPVAVQPLPFALAGIAIRDNESEVFSPVVQVTATMPTLTVATRACTPFTNTVHMPLITSDDLPGIGSIGPEKEFYIEMRCPTGLAYIGYYIVPVHGVENEAQGVIKINPNSSAKGIGLRITTRSTPHPVYIDESVGQLTATWQPIKFGATNRYRVYSSVQWGYPFGTGVNPDPLTDEMDHTAPGPGIPLKVAVYRTGEVIPGTYNAAIFIHLVYR